MKPYRETHQEGYIWIEQAFDQGVIVGDFGIQIAGDGRIWICINGQALIRFSPDRGYNNGKGRVDVDNDEKTP